MSEKIPVPTPKPWIRKSGDIITQAQTMMADTPKP